MRVLRSSDKIIITHAFRFRAIIIHMVTIGERRLHFYSIFCYQDFLNDTFNHVDN